MKKPPSTRASLILRLRKPGDLEAWEQFSELYEPFIFRMARGRGLQDADAHDLTQEVMVRVAKSVSSWEPDQGKGSFRGWLSRITRNMVVDFMRSRSRKINSVEFAEDVAECPESELYDLELRKQAFVWASDKVRPLLKEATWRSFWMTAVENKSATEAARETGLSVGAVYIAKSRVMAKLRDVVQQAIKRDEMAFEDTRDGGQP
jgi:RNA polymerase sigma-70 factor (ECF subfamily)